MYFDDYDDELVLVFNKFEFFSLIFVWFCLMGLVILLLLSGICWVLAMVVDGMSQFDFFWLFFPLVYGPIPKVMEILSCPSELRIIWY